MCSSDLSLGCKLWFNPLFNSISGGHTEHINAIQSWDWFIQHEAKIIQTDFPFELMEYLIGQKLHPKPPNFKMPGLKNLPNGNPQKNIKKTTLTSKKSSLRRNKKIKKYKKGLKKH